MISENKKILFLYDQSRQVGNGHFQRCKYFSHIFPRSFKFYFTNTKKKQHILSKNFFFRFGIIDSYLIKSKEEKKIKKICQTLITIDDFTRKNFSSDIVINYSPSAKRKFYSDNGNKFLLGDEYNFIKQEKKYEIYEKKIKFNLFFYFGLKNRKKKINQIISNIKKKELINKIFIFGNSNKKISHKKFMNAMRKSDIVISSAGVTLQEAISHNKMIFAKYFSLNQKNFFELYLKKKIINDVKEFSKFMSLPLNKINSVLKLRKKKIQNLNYKHIKKKRKIWKIIKNV